MSESERLAMWEGHDAPLLVPEPRQEPPPTLTFERKVRALLRDIPQDSYDGLVGTEYKAIPPRELGDEEDVLRELRNLLSDRSYFMRQRDQRIDPTELYFHGILHRSEHQGAMEGRNLTHLLITRFEELQKLSRTGPCGQCQNTKAALKVASDTITRAAKMVTDLKEAS